MNEPTNWDAAHVRLQTLRFHAIDNLDAQERAFRAGQLHLASLPIVKAATLLATQLPTLSRVPGLRVSFINVNTARPPLNDPRVRRALALAFDRSA